MKTRSWSNLEQAFVPQFAFGSNYPLTRCRLNDLGNLEDKMRRNEAVHSRTIIVIIPSKEWLNNLTSEFHIGNDHFIAYLTKDGRISK